MNEPAHSDRDGAVELRLWRQFLAVAESLHFGRAAKNLGMTQPPLTQAIQRLEATLRVRLFQRTRRSVALTPAGTALVEPVRQLLGQASRLGELAQAAALGGSGTVRLGFVSTVGFGSLPDWVRSFRTIYPGITLRLREATWDVQEKALAAGELDAGFVAHAPGLAPTSCVPLRRISLGLEPLVVVQHRATSPRVRTVSELLSQPLVIFPRESGPSLYDAILAFYHRHGASPTIAQEAIQIQTIVNLVSAGLGIALVPRVVTNLRRSGVVYRPLPRALSPSPRWETSLVWLEDAPPATLRLVEFVARAAKTGGTRCG